MHCITLLKVNNIVILVNHKTDEATKLTSEASISEDNDLVQNLQVLDEIPPKAVLSSHKGSLHCPEEEIK